MYRMKLMVTRHGETVENEQGILSGHLPGRLSDTGVEQAKLLALRLKDEQIDWIYCSDLTRATDTLKEIIQYHPGIPIRLDKRLRETDYRSLTGKSKKLFDFKHWSPKVESRSSMRKRAKELLDEVCSIHQDETVLFVGHSGINRALISVILNKPVHYMDDIHGLTNTAIFACEITHGSTKIRMFNSIDHLELMK